MGRDNPRNPSPVGKPSITARASVKSMGSLIPPRGSHGTEYGQTSAPTTTGGGKSGAAAEQKGKLSIAPTPGGEYRQVCSGC